ncbi:FG-GAP repeat domain-containing protein [Candidatus Midichloria mitochondrii]|nr:VCBS repeat-containing protein [Candidatus Midichloria mitochondrii]
MMVARCINKANFFSQTISVLLGNGSGGFVSRQDYEVGYSPQRLSLADVNLDGKLDVVVATNFDNPISILLGNGQGSFSGYKGIDLGTYAIVCDRY